MSESAIAQSCSRVSEGNRARTAGVLRSWWRMSRSASLIRVRWPIMAWMYSRAGSWSGMGVSFHRQLRRSYAAGQARKSGRGRILFHQKAARPFGGAKAEDDMATRVRGGAFLEVRFIGDSVTPRT